MMKGQVLAPWHLPARVGGTGRVAATMGGADVAGPDEAGVADPVAERGAFRPIEEELRDLERRRMEEALRHSGGPHNRAAELISMPLRTFARKVKLYGLSVPPKKG